MNLVSIINAMRNYDIPSTGSGQMAHRINEFFFLTDPHKLIATHLPRDERWQLLDKSSMLTQQDFEEVCPF